MRSAPRGRSLVQAAAQAEALLEQGRLARVRAPRAADLPDGHATVRDVFRDVAVREGVDARMALMVTWAADHASEQQWQPLLRRFLRLLRRSTSLRPADWAKLDAACRRRAVEAWLTGAAWGDERERDRIAAAQAVVRLLARMETGEVVPPAELAEVRDAAWRTGSTCAWCARPAAPGARDRPTPRRAHRGRPRRARGGAPAPRGVTVTGGVGRREMSGALDRLVPWMMGASRQATTRRLPNLLRRAPALAADDWARLAMTWRRRALEVALGCVGDAAFGPTREVARLGARAEAGEHVPSEAWTEAAQKARRQGAGNCQKAEDGADAAAVVAWRSGTSTRNREGENSL